MRCLAVLALLLVAAGSAVAGIDFDQNGPEQYYAVSSDVLASYPHSIFARFAKDDTVTNGTVLSVARGVAENKFYSMYVKDDAGAHPTMIRPGSLSHYWDCQQAGATLTDLVGGADMTRQGSPTTVGVPPLVPRPGAQQ